MKPFTPEEAQWLKVERGQSSSQAVCEAYAVLRAAKLWQRRIQCKGLILKSDSSVALGIAKKLSSPSPSLNYIAAELACLLDTIDVRQIEIYHIPQTFNKEADWLSRPHERGDMPETLQGIRLKKLKGQVLEDFKVPPPGPRLVQPVGRLASAPWKRVGVAVATWCGARTSHATSLGKGC